ncbi:hypothetical protein KEM56_002297, partial [Ascosphaera pollenicola]
MDSTTTECVIQSPRPITSPRIESSQISLTHAIRLPPIKACLFDMDGLLINTEDMYTAVVNTILT